MVMISRFLKLLAQRCKLKDQFQNAVKNLYKTFLECPFVDVIESLSWKEIHFG